jgi:hypothetical protein
VVSKDKREKNHFIFNLKYNTLLDVVVQACNPSTWEAEARELQVQGQPMVYSETQAKTKQTRHCDKNPIIPCFFKRMP